MAEPITDRMLGTTQIVALADRLEAVLGDGAELHTVRSVGGRLLGATLTERVALLRDALLADLQGDWPAFADVVWRALEDERFAGWFIWPVGDAVAARALDESAPSAFDEGLDLLVALTPRLTSEFSLRPFLASDLHRTLDAARRWSGSADQHVRRLASEGTRPRLPWAVRVRAARRAGGHNPDPRCALSGSVPARAPISGKPPRRPRQGSSAAGGSDRNAMARIS